MRVSDEFLIGTWAREYGPWSPAADQRANGAHARQSDLPEAGRAFAHGAVGAAVGGCHVRRSQVAIKRQRYYADNACVQIRAGFSSVGLRTFRSAPSFASNPSVNFASRAKPLKIKRSRRVAAPKKFVFGNQKRCVWILDE